MVAHLARVLVVAALGGCVHAALQTPGPPKRVPKQIHTKATVVDTEDDHNAAESHFGGGEGAGHGKYFMDTIMIQTGPKQIEFGHVCENPHEWEQRYERQDQDNKHYQGKHLPHHDHYEFGYRRGNEHHFKERYEKAQPHHGHFKTKARWGDKHGGYGEHHWDYNHGGHHGDEGGSNDDEGGDGSNPVPEYHPAAEERVKRQHKIASDKNGAQSHYDNDGGQGHLEKRGGQSHYDNDGGQGHIDKGVGQELADISLAFDTESGTVVDERTGKRYLLTPIN